MSGIFKAYDVRGIYPDELNEEIVRSVGLTFRETLDEQDRAQGNTVVVSRDMRSHSGPLAEALIDGLTAGGLDVLDIGLATTPMNYFAVGHLGTAAGIQVTASHNPARYNGLKFSRSDARPFTGERGIPYLERLVTAGGGEPASRAGAVSTGAVFDEYSSKLLSFVEPSAGRRLRVVVDAANGMGCLYEPILRRLDIDLVPLYFELDGTFPNHEANPLKLDNLRDLTARIRDSGADLGVAFDGDADRAAFVDETGEPVGSDLMTGLIAGELLRHEPGGVVPYDLRSSRAVPEYVREQGGVPVRERVGHTFIKATLRQRHGIFGGELAGHYYFRDTYHADSSLLAVIEVLNLLGRSGRPMSELVAPLHRYAKSPEINFEVEDKSGKIEELACRYAEGEIDYLDGITVQYPDWWFNVRPSNTEPYLRLVLEAATPDQLAGKRAELESLLGTPV
ncbi:MAG: phosphomannomutase/phosphoglucomutase [Thermoanaerobaculia bacterium]